MSQRWQVILSNLAVVALFSVACASGTNERLRYSHREWKGR